MSEQSIYTEITTNEELKLFADNSLICVVDFCATWCGPCKKLAEELQNVLKSENFYNSVFIPNGTQVSTHDLVNKISFVKVDVDDAQDLAEEYDVSALPFVKFFRKGKLQNGEVKGCDPSGIVNIINLLYSVQEPTN